VTGRAAGVVEKALAAAVPMAVGFLANFIRLGNLGERVKELLEPVQSKVEAAIGTIIDKALEAGRAILDRLGLAGGPKETVTFTDNGETHTISAQGEADQETIYVETTRKTADQHLSDWESGDIAKLPRSSDARLAKGYVTRARNVLAKRRKLKETKLSELEEPSKLLFRLLGHPTVPETKLTSKTISGGKQAEARPLTLKFDTNWSPSSSTSAELPSDARMRQLNLVKDEWVKMHLIHFDLGGPNEAWNFAPGTKSANARMYREAEKVVITQLTSAAAAGRRVMWLLTKVLTHPRPNEDFSADVSVEFGEMDPKGQKKVAGTEVKAGPFLSDKPGAGVTSADLSKDSARDLNLVGGLDEEYANAVAASQYVRRYRDVDDIVDAVTARRPNFTDFKGLRAALVTGIGKGRLTL
jgi:hypothetical protein